MQSRFGIAPTPQTIEIAQGATIRLGAGHLILLTGPSGSGKSSALAALKFQIAANCIDVQQVSFDSESALIDEIAPDADFAEAASILTACGLGEPALWLRPYAALSEGEKFRARLAKAISVGDQGSAVSNLAERILLCDEFCSGLHRRAAKAIAHNLRKLVTRRGLCVVVACSASDLTDELAPDIIVTFGTHGRCEIEQRAPRNNSIAHWHRKVRIEPGGKRDYEFFATMHYRSTDELGFVDRVFVLREKATGDALGIVVYSHAPLELALRNQATGGWFSKNPQRVNEHLRILRRLVIHPDVRGCGLGHYLVRKTMPRLGTDFVECLAAMGEFNPVFERAGMIRIGQYDVPSGPQKALESLREMDAGPQAADFAIHIARRPAVRALVAGAVADWYAATTGAGGETRAERQSPETLARTFRSLIGVRPVYYLWHREKTIGTTTVTERGRTRNAREEKNDKSNPSFSVNEKSARRVSRSHAVSEAVA